MHGLVELLDSKVTIHAIPPVLSVLGKYLQRHCFLSSVVTSFIMKCLFSSSSLVCYVVLNSAYVMFVIILLFTEIYALSVRTLVGRLMIFFGRECESV